MPFTAEKTVVYIADDDSIQYLVDLLEKCQQQLRNSNTFLYHSEDDAVEKAQKAENEKTETELKQAVKEIKKMVTTEK